MYPGSISRSLPGRRKRRLNAACSGTAARCLPPPLEGRLVILVDDGVATGFTLRAALRGLKQSRPERLVLAVPVGPPETLESLSREVDEIHYLSAPPWFEAVGQFYDDFSQVSDEEVMELLRRAANGEQE